MSYLIFEEREVYFRDVFSRPIRELLSYHLRAWELKSKPRVSKTGGTTDFAKALGINKFAQHYQGTYSPDRNCEGGGG